MKPLNTRLDKINMDWPSTGGESPCDKYTQQLVTKVTKESQRAEFWTNFAITSSALSFCFGILVGIFIK